MTDTPLVSVILPFHNAPYLQEAIDSILQQSYQNLELILINNGSTDSSLDVAKSYTHHEQVKIINEDKKGVVHAANAGIVESEGEFIARMDADDIAEIDRIKHQVEMLLEDEELGVVSGLVEYLGPKENEGFIHYVKWLNTLKSPDEIALNQFVEFPIANPTMMVRRTVFDHYGTFMEGDFPEDYEFFLRLQEKGVKMQKVDRLVLKWRDTVTRLTRTDQRYSQDAFFKIKAKYLVEWLRKHNPFHPNIWIWGAGRVSRRRSDYLKAEGVNIDGYIDVKEGEGVLHYNHTPDKNDVFIVSYVSNRGVRDEIRSFLTNKGFIEGVHFIMAS